MKVVAETVEKVKKKRKIDEVDTEAKVRVHVRHVLCNMVDVPRSRKERTRKRNPKNASPRLELWLQSHR
jgi:hypothetical protein